MSFQKVYVLLVTFKDQGNEEIKRLIKDKNLYHAVDLSGNTLLHYAAKTGNHEMVQYLIDSGSDVNATNKLDQYPLVIALQTDLPCKKLIEILLKADADILFRDKMGISALSIVDSVDWLSEDKDRFEIYKLFLENADDLNEFKLLQDENEKFIKMLLDTGIDLTISDSDRNTLIHMFAKNINPGIMNLLHGKTYDINARNFFDDTPLTAAAFIGTASAIEFLLDEGADIEAVNFSKVTALYIACEESRSEFDNDDEDKICVQLLLERGANAQIIVEDDLRPTIFDTILARQSFTSGELVLARLALQEKSGIVITELIRSKIESYDRFRIFFENCKRQLSMEIHPSVTLFDVLSASDRKFERYCNNKELALQIGVLKIADYYETILRRRVSNAMSMIELRHNAASFVAELIKMDYRCYPFIADEIVSYLEKKDMEQLISIFLAKF